MLYSVDRFEGEYAVLVGEDKISCSVLRTLLPDSVNEGDMVRLTDGEYRLDDAAAEERRKQILRLQKKLRGIR